MEAFNQWQTAQAHLKESVHTFFEACTALQNAIAQPPPASRNLASIEQTILKLHSHIDLVSLVERKIAESRAVVNRVLNTSTTLVQVNILPPEVLIRVFTFATLPFSCSEQSQGQNQLLPISSVCTHWRELVISTRSLWSHIDVYMGSDGDFSSDCRFLCAARLFLKRAHGVPLHMHFRSGDYITCADYTSRLVSTLKPHVPFFSSLVFSVGVTESNFQAVLSLCASHGTPGSLVAFSLTEPWTNGQDPYIWPTEYLRGLADLQLNGLPEIICPTLDELASVLSSSPLLHTLRLQAMRVPPGHGLGTRSISLPFLRLLDVVGTHHVHLERILSLLSPGTLPLDLRLELSESSSDELIVTIQSFLKRSNVGVLCLRGLRRHAITQFTRYVFYLPRLRTLFLDCTYDRDCASLDALTAPNELAGPAVARCPNLRALHIMRTRIGPPGRERVKRVVEAHSLSTIAFVHCDFYDERFPSGSSSASSYGDMEVWLRPLVKTVTFVEEDEDEENENPIRLDNEKDWDLYIQEHISEVLR